MSSTYTLSADINENEAGGYSNADAQKVFDALKPRLEQMISEFIGETIHEVATEDMPEYLDKEDPVQDFISYWEIGYPMLVKM